MLLLKMVLTFLPSIFIHENVIRFPADFLSSVLGMLYEVEHHVLDSSELTALPVRRKRRYTICRLKTKLVMYKPLSYVCSVLAFAGSLVIDDLMIAVVDEHSPLLKLTESMQRMLDKYLQLAPADDVYDLTQNPEHRSRSCSEKLMTLTKGCAHLWIKSRSRRF